MGQSGSSPEVGAGPAKPRDEASRIAALEARLAAAEARIAALEGHAMAVSIQPNPFASAEVQVMTEPLSRSKPWGWKVTIHVYGTGAKPSSALLIEVANKAAEHVGADDFVGVDYKVVKKRPSDQVAS